MTVMLARVGVDGVPGLLLFPPDGEFGDEPPPEQAAISRAIETIELFR